MGAGRARPQQPSAEDIEIVWIALMDGTPAATAALLRNPGYWEVKRVFVAPAFRRRALARALALVEESAQAVGAVEIVLQTGILQMSGTWHRALPKVAAHLMTSVRGAPGAPGHLGCDHVREGSPGP